MKKLKLLSLLCLLGLSINILSACGAMDQKDTDTEEVENEDYVIYVVPDDYKSPVLSEPEIEQIDDTDEDLLDPSWFDDAVFIGDSITLKLSFYNDATFALGNAKFVCAASLGWGNSQWEMDDPNAVHPYYNGYKVLAENAVVTTNAKKAIIGLGMNDIGVFGVDASIENARTLIQKIKVKSPGTDIYIESVTPMIEYAQYGTLNNDLIREFNSNLESMCQEMGCHYLNTHDSFTDEYGNLPLEYCSDPEDLGIHFTDEACEIWVNYLRSNIKD